MAFYWKTERPGRGDPTSLLILNRDRLAGWNMSHLLSPDIENSKERYFLIMSLVTDTPGRQFFFFKQRFANGWNIPAKQIPRSGKVRSKGMCACTLCHVCATFYVHQQYRWTIAFLHLCKKNVLSNLAPFLSGNSRVHNERRQ